MSAMVLPFTITNENSSRELPPSLTAFRTREPGDAHLYSVAAAKGTLLFLSYVEWESGNREVRVEEVESDVSNVHRLTHGLRLSIERVLFDGRWYDCFALRSARLNSDDTWSNLYDVSPRAIDEAAGYSAMQALAELGVEHVVKGDKLVGKARHRHFALFPVRDQIVPMNAFMITRLLPLLYRIRHSEQMRLF